MTVGEHLVGGNQISTEWEVKSEEMDWEQEAQLIFTDATVLVVSDKPQAKQTS